LHPLFVAAALFGPQKRDRLAPGRESASGAIRFAGPAREAYFALRAFSFVVV